jgi:hypothetical protein
MLFFVFPKCRDISTIPHGIISQMTVMMKKIIIIIIPRARGSVVVEALCYKPEGCGFDNK